MSEKDVVNNFLNDITESRDVFKEEAVPEVEEPVVEEKEEKHIPFHKDPKVQRYVEKQISKALENVRPSSNERESREVTSNDVKDVIAAFTNIIGNDTPEKVRALETLERTLQGADERASQKAIERFQQQQEEILQRQSEEDSKAQEELENSLDEIEETYNVDLSSNSAAAKQTRSQFIDYVRKIAPKDEYGEVAAFPDLISAFEEFQERNKRPAATRAKELANRGMARSGDTTTAAPTSRTWKDADRFIAQLKTK